MARNHVACEPVAGTVTPGPPGGPASLDRGSVANTSGRTGAAEAEVSETSTRFRDARMSRKDRKKKRPRWLRATLGVLQLAMIVAGAVALWHQRGQIDQAARLLVHLKWHWVVLAAAAEVSSMVLFARMQRWLLRAGGVDLKLWAMIKITLAGNSMAVSLPGGAAWSAGFAFEQLRRRGASKEVSVWVVIVAGAVSSLALFLLLVTGTELAGDHGPARGFRILGIALCLLLVAILAALIGWLRSENTRGRLSRLGQWLQRQGTLANRALSFGAELVNRLRVVQTRPSAIGGAFVMAAGNWLADAVCLLGALLAVGAPVPWWGLLVAYGVAQIGASLPITPGGVGVVEGTLTYALIAYGVPVKQAVAAMLLYRIISFWALVPIGWLAWAVLKADVDSSSERVQSMA